MNERRNREIKYNMIINNVQGKSYLIEEAIIKEEQCFNCKKQGNIKLCRLKIENQRCVNYEKKMDKRKR